MLINPKYLTKQFFYFKKYLLITFLLFIYFNFLKNSLVEYLKNKFIIFLFTISFFMKQ